MSSLRPWEKAAIVSGKDNKATVPGLDENQEYEFRVIAVNKGGESEPSEPSQGVITKPRFSKYLWILQFSKVDFCY